MEDSYYLDDCEHDTDFYIYKNSALSLSGF